jgi:endonuclease/exonuclease/phosphatase family metal-dependent hydrolase
MKYILYSISLLLISACATENSTDSMFRSSTLPADSVLTVGTFNIAWLGDGYDDRIDRTDSDHKNIANIIELLEADVLALQEIENENSLRKIIKYLDGYDYKMIDTEAPQDNAIIHRTNVNIDEISLYMPVNVMEGRTRPGLLINASKAGKDFELMSVHFKSTSRYDDTPEKRELSFELRRKQSAAVSRYVDSMISAGKYNFMIVGDMNDNPNRKSTNISELSSRLRFLTDSLESCKNPDWDMIDHIALSPAMYRIYLDQSLFVYDFYSSMNEVTARKISDHCPVVATFWLGSI